MGEKQSETTRLDKSAEAGPPFIQVVSPDEFADLDIGEGEMRDAFHDLVTARSTYLDIYPGSLIGSFAIPDKRDILHEPLFLAFYLDKEHLVFIDGDGTFADLLNPSAQRQVREQSTVAYSLFEFMKLLVKDDLSFLTQIEDRMEHVEEQILDRELDTASRKMLGFRRNLLRIDTYYQQLVDMSSIAAANENHLLIHEEARMFTLFSHQAERLLKRSQTLKEYSFQLRELYQTQIDIKQNDTIQWFTVITTIFVPLTLITSWYGMNFRFMPELNMPWSYFVIMAVCAVIVIFELRFFKRKKWL